MLTTQIDECLFYLINRPLGYRLQLANYSHSQADGLEQNCIQSMASTLRLVIHISLSGDSGKKSTHGWIVCFCAFFTSGEGPPPHTHTHTHFKGDGVTDCCTPFQWGFISISPFST